MAAQESHKLQVVVRVDCPPPFVRDHNSKTSSLTERETTIRSWDANLSTCCRRGALRKQTQRAISSVVEHPLDKRVVGGSIPSLPTIL